ncbi:MAG: threonine synthase [Candidatus Zixiibacteriota bacterium]
MDFAYLCSECGLVLEITQDIMVCPECSRLQRDGEPLRGILEVVIFGELPENWNIHDMLPVKRQFFPEIPVGNTPLWKPEKLRSELGFMELYIKDDTRNPTNSLKDRASLLVSAFARRFNIGDIAVASTGNAASSMAGIGASANQNIVIFVPESAPQAKLVQAIQYGARVLPVAGNYDMAFDISLEYSKLTGALSRNTAYNPMTIEGKKTVAVEIAQQLGNAPDHVFVPVGDGAIIGGVFKGFEDLLEYKIIDKMPKIYAVQAMGSSAICHAKENGDFKMKIPAVTLADSISVDVPRNGYYALNKLRKHNGECIIVSDEEILDAQKFLSSYAGCFAEPSGAAAMAGFLNRKDNIPIGESIVLLITGSGLKDIDSAKRRIKMPSHSIKNAEEAIF